MKVLLSTDFGKDARIAIDYATSLFSEETFKDARFFLVHAYHEDSGMSEDEAEQHLEDERNRLSPFLGNISSYFHHGSIRHVLNSCIDEYLIDLVVMGSRDKGDVDQGAIGSNAMEISTHAKCSVLVIPNDVEISKKPESIAFGSDYHSMNVPREALVVLKSLLKAYDATLKIFHVYSEGDEAELVKEIEKNVSAHFIERSKHEYHAVINHEIIEGIKHFVEKEKPDVLTVIPREHSFMDELYNPSVTKSMSFNVNVPLLVLR